MLSCIQNVAQPFHVLDTWWWEQLLVDGGYIGSWVIVCRSFTGGSKISRTKLISQCIALSFVVHYSLFCSALLTLLQVHCSLFCSTLHPLFHGVSLSFHFAVCQLSCWLAAHCSLFCAHCSLLLHHAALSFDTCIAISFGTLLSFGALLSLLVDCSLSGYVVLSFL